MGGGTTVIESVIRRRRAVGSDLNSLAVFVARAKTTLLSDADASALRRWATMWFLLSRYWLTPHDLAEFICERRTKNLTLPEARPIKKVMALALRSLSGLSDEAVRFGRCALLNTGQWALNGRTHQPPLSEFRNRLREIVHEMLSGLSALGASADPNCLPPTLIDASAAMLHQYGPFSTGARASLVVTSPPYPGIHMLYHRWQVDGRHESPAPYWLAACNDGHGATFYNFAYRSENAADKYVDESLRTLTGIRKVMRDGAIIVQLIAFANPKRHLRRYLANMEAAGFSELHEKRRTWRNVPGRKWHATLKGTLPSAREVVLIHEAV